MSSDRLLEVDDLRVHFASEERFARAVDGVSLTIDRGETLVIVGESGSGKSVTSLALLGLVPSPPGIIAGGSAIFRGKDGQTRDLLRLSRAEQRHIRGNDIAIVFQEPMSSLSPVYTVGDQIAEAIVAHQGKRRGAALQLAAEMIALMGIPDPERQLKAYPHQISGGMAQRVMIAMALSCRPSLLIADEPTTALDVTIQAQILELIQRLQAEIGMAVLFITHNLGVVAEIANRVAVMYAGRIVETGPAETIFANPRMPYTAGLLGSVPRIGAAGEMPKLSAIPGEVPDPARLPQGCAFHPRCAHFEAERCDAAVPPLVLCGPGHHARCVRWREIAGAGAA
jgi:peptide/nickel transport system ATP-binding protein